MIVETLKRTIPKGERIGNYEFPHGGNILYEFAIYEVLSIVRKRIYRNAFQHHLDVNDESFFTGKKEKVIDEERTLSDDERDYLLHLMEVRREK